MMKFAICNEIFKEFELEKQFATAAELGFDGLEIAPFTLADWVQDIRPETRQRIVELGRQYNVEIVGLHWLLVGPTGLHVTDPDPAVRRRTREYLQDLVRMGLEVGAGLIVVGSPAQRNVKPGVDPQEARAWFKEAMTACADLPGAEDFKVCLEPLLSSSTNFLNRASEARELALEIGRPNVGVILDCYSMSHEEPDPPQALRDCRDVLFHVHVNDNNQRGPGWGTFDFASVFKALVEIGYNRYVSMEVFDFELDPVEHAGRSIRFLRETLQAAEEDQR